MKINLTFDGTPDEIREAIAAALVADATRQAEANGRPYIEFDEHMACTNSAYEIVQGAVQYGTTDVLLGPVTEQRQRQLAGVL